MCCLWKLPLNKANNLRTQTFFYVAKDLRKTVHITSNLGVGGSNPSERANYPGLSAAFGPAQIASCDTVPLVKPRGMAIWALEGA